MLPKPLAWSCAGVCLCLCRRDLIFVCYVRWNHLHCIPDLLPLYTWVHTDDHTACPPNQREASPKKQPTLRLQPSRPCTTHWPINRSSSTALARTDKFRWWVSDILSHIFMCFNGKCTAKCSLIVRVFIILSHNIYQICILQLAPFFWFFFFQFFFLAVFILFEGPIEQDL